MVSKKFLLKSNLKNTVEKYPFIEEFLKDNQIEIELNKNIGDHRNLAGWGVGVQYARPNDYYLRVDYARKLNGEVYQSEENDKNGRVWFLAYKLF